MANNVKEMQFELEGITCTGCASDIENLLREKDGILDVSVNFANGTINVRYDPGIIDRRKLFLTIRKVGFKTKIFSGP